MAPITIAAVGRHSHRFAGEVADGVRLHGFRTRRYLEEICLPRITEGLAWTGRKRACFEVTGGGFVATGAADQEIAQAVEWVRYRVAFYGSTPGYWPVLDLHGLGDLGRKLDRMTKEGRGAGLPRRSMTIRYACSPRWAATMSSPQRSISDSAARRIRSISASRWTCGRSSRPT